MSNLRGKIPSVEDKRFKVLMFGVAGAGKTTAAIQFPRPYVLDTEAGCVNDQYIRVIESGGGAIAPIVVFDDILTEIRTLMEEEHPYATLVIDPITTVNDMLLDRLKEEVGTDYGAHYTEAKRKFKQMMSLLARLDMNVVVTAHHKNQYGDGMTLLGKTFDGPKNLDYLFDLVMEIQIRGDERWAIPVKSRVERIRQGEPFLFSYNTIAERYGREVLERQAKAQELVSAERLAVWEQLLMKFGTREADFRRKILAKFDIGELADASAEVAEKSIAKLTKILETEK
jgi:hypothetical protein